MTLLRTTGLADYGRKYGIPHMPYSNTQQMRARVVAMRRMAETFDVETRRLILAEAEKLEAEANRIDRCAKPGSPADRAGQR
jgi:hypothetical protein